MNCPKCGRNMVTGVNIYPDGPADPSMPGSVCACGFFVIDEPECTLDEKCQCEDCQKERQWPADR